MATATLLATLLNSAAAASPECLNKQCLNFFIYIYCFSTYGPTHSAAPHECVSNKLSPKMKAAKMLNSIILNYKHVLLERICLDSVLYMLVLQYN